MENKKLIKILLKDLTDVEELVADRSEGKFDPFEMELIATRIYSAKKLLNLLLENENHEFKPHLDDFYMKEMPVVELKKPVQPEPVFIPATEPKMDLEIPEKPIPATDFNPFVNQEVIPQPEKADNMPLFEIPVKEELTDVVVEQPDPVIPKTEIAGQGNENIVRIGDKFTKEKSINDTVNEQNNLEFKLSNLPIVSIQNAIGVNDRFLYIRELFDGDSSKYSETVSSLDKMGDLKQAVDYLQKNYTWKKNETSLKFINLVKRKFIKQ